MASSASTYSRLSNIQILRGVAALLVLLSHVTKELVHRVELDVRDVLNLAISGQFGVDIFFVISGFIMIYVSRNEIGSLAGGFSFFAKRVVRLVPIYWIFTTLTIIISLALSSLKNHNELDPAYILASYFFVPIERGTDAHFTPALGVGWTLNYEMYFYALFAIALTFPKKFYFGVFSFLFLGMIALGFFVDKADPQLWYWTRPIIGEFLAGGILAWLYVKGIGIPRGAAVGTFVVGVAWWLMGSSIIPDPTESSVRFQVWGIPAVLIVLAIVLARNSKTKYAGQSKMAIKFYRLAESAGDSSYSLYLTHMFVVRALTIALPINLFKQTYPVVYVLLAIIISFIFAHFCFRFLEKPLNTWLRKFIDKPRIVTAV